MDSETGSEFEMSLDEFDESSSDDDESEADSASEESEEDEDMSDSGEDWDQLEDQARQGKNKVYKDVCNNPLTSRSLPVLF